MTSSLRKPIILVMVAIAIEILTDNQVGAANTESSKQPQPLESTGKYKAVYGDDWKSYDSNEALYAVHQWWAWNRDVPWQPYISLVPDETLGRVVRMTQPEQYPGAPNKVPRTFYLTIRFNEPLDNVWVRFRVRFSPGFDLRGSFPPKANPAYKLFFLLFEGAGGRTGIEFANSGQYIYTNLQGGFQRDREETFGTHKWGGRVEGEFTDGQWYEFIVHREVTGPNTYVNRFYRRRLTEKTNIVNLTWNFWGISTVGEPGQRAKPAGAICLGANKNRSNDKTQHVYWGPWEVVDGPKYPNPFKLPLE